MKRKFRSGDRVQPRHGGPTMEVVKYVTDHQVLVGDSFSDHHVECAWYEDGKQKTEVFDQRVLFKIDDGGGLFTD